MDSYLKQQEGQEEADPAAEAPSSGLKRKASVTGQAGQSPTGPAKRRRSNRTSSSGNVSRVPLFRAISRQIFHGMQVFYIANHSFLQDTQNDCYCWICHKEGEVICCETCPRVFHLKCIQLEIAPTEDWVCPECVLIMTAENMDTR